MTWKDGFNNAVVFATGYTGEWDDVKVVVDGTNGGGGCESCYFSGYMSIEVRILNRGATVFSSTFDEDEGGRASTFWQKVMTH